MTTYLSRLSSKISASHDILGRRFSTKTSSDQNFFSCRLTSHLTSVPATIVNGQNTDNINAEFVIRDKSYPSILSLENSALQLNFVHTKG